MSKVLKIGMQHKPRFIGEEDGTVYVNVSLRPERVKRAMGRKPLVSIGKNIFTLEEVKMLKRAKDGLRKRFRLTLVTQGTLTTF